VTTFDRSHGNGHGNGGAPRLPEGPLTPPQNLEAEQSVLGAVLLSDTALPALIIDERLHPEDFYREAHGVIFAAMLELHTAGENIDALTLVEHLKQSGRLEAAGGGATVDLLAASVPAVGHLRQYARIVRENAMLRRLLRASYEIQARVHAHDAPPRELVDIAERTILEVAHEDSRKDFRAVHDVLFAELDKLEKLSVEGKAITGTASGFDDLDTITGGFQPGNLIILAARPSMGKSALMANFAENAALGARKAVALFSLEMSESELAQRFIASQASIKGDDLRKGKVPPSRWGKIMEASNRLAQSPLFIDDSSDLSVLDVRAKARRLLQQHADGLGLILIDYLQLMRADGRTDNRVEQIGQISRGLKTLARELEVPVIALSQLNRGVEQRTDKRPVLSDLRESGCLTGDTRVYLPDTGHYRRIDSLAGTRGFRVMALNTQTWRLEPCRVSNAFATGRKPVHLLRTRLGRRIRATANHRFLTIDGWRRLDELEAGTFIALPRRLPSPEHPTMTDAELGLPGHRLGDGCTLPRHAGRTRHNTNRDVLPAAVWDSIVAPARRAAGLTERAFQRRLGTAYCGSTLYRANLGRERAARVAEVVRSAELRRLAQGDVYWDRVSSIEPDGTEEVYDLTVDGLHNFVADDIVVHNSIEQDADLVMFIYRDEYYDKESEREGIADVIISKHRNGGLGTIELTFQKDYPRFMSYIGDDRY
jgi:replicative DNA helicase